MHYLVTKINISDYCFSILPAIFARCCVPCALQGWRLIKVISSDCTFWSKSFSLDIHNCSDIIILFNTLSLKKTNVRYCSSKWFTMRHVEKMFTWLYSLSYNFCCCWATRDFSSHGNRQRQSKEGFGATLWIIRWAQPNHHTTFTHTDALT